MSLRQLRLCHPVGSLSYDKAARHMLRWCDSYSRVETLLALKSRMFFADWWTLLGEEWTVCDNIAEYEPQLRRLLQRARPDQLSYMMSQKERTALKKLPRTLNVFRGCYGVNRGGLCYSLSRNVAARFPTLNRYRRHGDTPLLLSGTVDRQRVALKLDRGEQEVVSGNVRVVHEEEIVTT